MKIQKETIDAATLAAFDFQNFDEIHRMDEGEWKQMLSNGYVAQYVARDEEQNVAGILILKTASVNCGMWYFYSVAIDQKYRRMNLGTRMFHEAIGAEIPTGKINSHCHVDNEASISFHESLGFHAVQYVPDFYGDYEDAIMWERVR
jgi:ribosomal protein S18 acetylase RimI-like enzyme